ncbi:MAG: hypothetical protein U0R19_41060 [Bryobacteraceae bacterium]
MALVLIHVLISLAGIATGVAVMKGLLSNKRIDLWTNLFLASNVATNLSGFILPADRILPSHIVGFISMAALALAYAARKRLQASGAWRRTFVASSAFALYLNVFVAVVQAFQKIPALRAMAPTQSEPPFLVAQLAVLSVFIGLGIVATQRFRPVQASY